MGLSLSQMAMAQEVWKIDSWHRNLGYQFDSITRQLDLFLGADYVVEDEAHSRVRLQLDTSYEQGEGFKIHPRFSAKFILPALKKRFRIWLTTESRNRESANSRIGRDGVDMTQDNTAGTELMMRLLERDGQRNQFKLDLGIRHYDARLQPFTRLRWRYLLPLDGRWSGRLFNSYRYFALSGGDNEAGFTIQRLLGGRQNTALRFSHRLRWDAARDGVLHLAQVTLFHTLKNRREVALEVQGRYRTKIDPELGDKFELAAIHLRYRRPWLRPWLFFEIWPGISWPATRQHRTSLGILFRTEVMFGH